MNLPIFTAEDPCLIGRVKDKFGAFSNMSAHSVHVDGVTWPRAEQLFQALRFAPDHEMRSILLAETNPMRAKMTVKPRLNEVVIAPRSVQDIYNMRKIIALKRAQHCNAVAVLLHNTMQRPIIEDCSRRPSESGLFWGARYVGADKWEGHNMLGSLWMEERENPLLWAEFKV
jgi:predicted NAD-dependent protein-ADP-ribosyltransferase YbiA (DUF1768 family)